MPDFFKITGDVDVRPNPDLIVRIAIQTSLRIAYISRLDPGECVRGDLLGLEIEPGVLEVTNCFQTKCTKLEVENEFKTKRETDTNRQKIVEALQHLNADPQPLGIWMSVTGSLYKVDDDLLEELYDRSHTLDPNTILLLFDLSRDEMGEMPFRCYQLSAKWFELRRQLELGAMTKDVFNKKSMALSSPLHEVECSGIESAFADAVRHLCAPSLEYRIQKDHAIQDAHMYMKERELAQLQVIIDRAVGQSSV